MRKMKYKIYSFRVLSLAFMLILSSCSKYNISPAGIKLPTHGSYQMLQGVRDGCDTNHSARGNSFYRAFFTFTQKPELIEDDEYFHAWYRGYIYCFHIIARRAFTSIDADMSPEHEWFWNKKQAGNPKVKWPWAQGIDVQLGTSGIKFFGEGENWANDMFNQQKQGCKGIYQC